MLDKLRKAFAFLITALMVLECVPAIAWAEAGEQIGQALAEAGVTSESDENSEVDSLEYEGSTNTETNPEEDLETSDSDATNPEVTAPIEDGPVGDVASSVGDPSDDADVPADSEELAPIANEPMSIANLSAADKADPEKSGLITHKDDGLAITFRNNPKAEDAGFELAENVVHKDEDGVDRPVWKNSAPQGSVTTYSTMVFETNEPCYVVFDYLLASRKNEESSNKNSSFRVTFTTKAGADSPTYSKLNPQAEQLDIDEVDLASSSNWKSAVMYLDATGKGAWFEHALESGDANPLHSAYVSNIRFYKDIDQVPESCKVHLTIVTSSGNAFTSNFWACFPDSALNKNLWLSSGDLEYGSSYDLPLNCELVRNSGPGKTESLEKGYSITGPDGETVYEWSPGDGDCRYVLTEPGNFTLRGELEPWTPIPTGLRVSVDKDGDGSFEEEKLTDSDLATIWKNSTDGEFGCEQAFSTDSTDWNWKISYDTGSSGIRLRAYENGIEIDTQVEGTTTSFIVMPKKARRHIKLVFSSDKCADRTLTLYFWRNRAALDAFPTLDLSLNYRIKNNIDSMVKSYGFNTLSDSSGTNRAFLFDGEKTDAGHESVYATSQSKQNSTTYSWTFSWGKNLEGMLSFDYMIVPYGEESDIEGTPAKYTFTVKRDTNFMVKPVLELDQDDGRADWTHYEIPISADLNPKAIVQVEFTTPTNGAYIAISNIVFDHDQRDITVNVDGNGTVKNGGSAVSNGAVFKKYRNGHLALEATAAAGSTFAGWYEGDKFVSGSPMLDYTVDETTTLTARFVASDASSEALVMAGNGAPEIVRTLDTALEKAASYGEGTLITLLKDASLTKSASIPSGVTLLVPCKEDDTGYDQTTGFNPEPTSSSKNQLYRTLTIPEDVTLTVQGTLLVNGVSGNPTKGSMISTPEDGYNAAVKMYEYGKVALAGSIEVENGGILDSSGYVEGSGRIHAKNGSTVGDLFVVRHWRGGTVASNMYFAHIFPFSEYSCRNIRASMTFESGASYEGLVRMYAQSTAYITRFPIIDVSNGLIRLAEGATATKTYNSANESSGNDKKGKIGVETIAITGGASFEQSTLDIAGMDLTTADYFYPWDGSHAFELDDGTYTFKNDMKFMPGSKISVTGADIVVDAGKKVVLYDETFVDSPPVGTGGNVLTGTEYTTGTGAATLTLDGGSSLTNNGSFFGTVTTSSPEILAGPSAAWSVTSKESNGATTRSIAFKWNDGDAKLSRTGGFTWKFGSNNRDIVWTGADYSALDAVLGQVPASADPYTEASWKAVQEAKDAAQKLKDGVLGGDRQGDIADAAKKLEDAISSLEKKTFAVTFKAGEGATLAGEGTQTIAYGENLDAENFPMATKPGYTFDGWFEGDGGQKVTELKGVTAAHTLTARWEAVEYGITYQNADGTPLASAPGFDWPDGTTDEQHPGTYTVEDAVTLAEPTRTGYTFAGWSITGADPAGKQPTGNTIPKGTMGELIAKASWTPLTFEVTFDAGEGAIYSSDASEEPLGTSYTVVVTYDDTYGNAKLKGGDQIVGLPIAKRAGYKPGGWQADGANITNETQVKVTRDVKLVQQWQVGDKYKIEYELNDAEGHSRATWPDGVEAGLVREYDVETPDITIPTPVRDGYTFLGWSRNGAMVPEDPAIVRQGTTQNLTFTAQWEIRHYQIELQANDGTFAGEAAESVPRDHFDKVGDLPEPTRNGYRLAGWEDADGKVWKPTELAGETVTGPMTLTARWETVAYDIHYELVDGAWPDGAAEADHPGTYNVESGPIQLPTPVKEGYTFLRWDVSEGIVTGEGSNLGNGLLATGSWGEVTLTAVWRVNTHGVTWVFGNGANDRVDGEVAYGTAPDVPDDPSRTGYRFDGWKGSDGELYAHQGDLAGFTMPDGDVTFTAQWTSYMDILDALVDEKAAGDASKLTGDALKTARTYYAELVRDPAQQSAYQTGPLFKAIEADLAATIDNEVRGAIDDVNTALTVDGTVIARLKVDGTSSSGTPIIDVELVTPSTKCVKLLNNKFLEKLFRCDYVETVTVGEQTCEKQQLDLMMAVAWDALHEDQGLLEDTEKNRTAFKDWLVSVEQTLDISVLAGCQVPASLNSTATDEGVTVSVPYLVRFHETDKDVEWKDLRTITFDVQGGDTTVPPIQKRPGLKVSGPTTRMTRTGYTFDAWYTQPKGAGDKFTFTADTVMPDHDLTLYANWEPIHYSVAFDAGAAGAQGAMEPRPLAYDEDLELPGCGFRLTGHTFGGWRVEGDASGHVYQPGESVRNLTAREGGTATLVAQWKANTYKVVLVPGEGATLPEGKGDTFDVTYGGTYAEGYGADLPTPEMVGYVFQGWWDGDAQVKGETTVSITDAQTLEARWTPSGDVHYEVRYFLQNLGDDGYPTEPERTFTSDNGSTGAEVTADRLVFPGFTLDLANSQLKGTVAADGSLVMDLRYTRNSYTVTYEVGDAAYQSTLRYGASAAYPHELAWDAESGAYAITGWQARSAEGALAGDVLGPKALPVVEGDATYVARLDKRYQAETPDGGVTWRTLEVAMEAAPELLAAGEGPSLGTDPFTGAPCVVVSLHGEIGPGGVMEPVTLEDDLTVPAGVMLLLPYALGDTGYDEADNHNQGIPGPPVNPASPTPATGAIGGEPYSELVVPDGATLSVEGRVLVNALVGRRVSGHHDQDVTGGFGRVELGEGAAVVVEPGGAFDCHGYVEGDGTVTARRGGTVGDLFVVRNWRGGSQAAAIFPKVYPYSEYDCHNISVPVTIDAGGTLEGLVTMFASGAYYSTRFPLVDPGNGLIRQAKGSTTRTYEGGRETWSVTGGAEFSRSTLYIIQMDLSTGSFMYPIDGDMDLVLSDGAYRFSEDYKFLTGSTIVCRDADVTVAPDATVVLYEEFDDPENTDGTEYPERDAAWISLDARSSLTNHGSFAGRVRAAAPSVHHARMDVAWEVETLEANGYYNTRPFGQETRTVANEVSIDCPGHTYEVSMRGEILWDGAESEFHPVEEMADIIGSGIGGGGAAGGAGEGGSDGEATVPVEGLEMETTLGEDGNITVEVALDEERSGGSAIGSAEDAVGALLRALAARADVFYSASTMTGKDDYTVILAEGVSGYDVRMFTERLGLVEAARAQAEAEADERTRAEKDKVAGQALALTADARANVLADEPIGADLNGVTGKIKVKGTEDYPVETTVTMVFHADEVEPEPEPEPEEPNLVAVYRLYNPYDGQHLLTTDRREYDELHAIGWNQEGIASWQPEVEAKVASLAEGAADAASAQTVVYRLYNPNNGDHLYTAKLNEANGLVPIGWRLEGVAFASAERTDEGATPVYRLWNPYMTDRAGLGSHLYTSDPNEYSELGRLGWNREDVYWYAASAPDGGV